MFRPMFLHIPGYVEITVELALSPSKHQFFFCLKIVLLVKKRSKVEDHGGHFSKVLGLGGGHTGTFSGQSKTKTCDMAVIDTIQ